MDNLCYTWEKINSENNGGFPKVVLLYWLKELTQNFFFENTNICGRSSFHVIAFERFPQLRRTEYLPFILTTKGHSHRLLQVAVKMTLLTLWQSAGICSTEVQLLINLEKSFKQITRKFKKRKSLILSFSWFYAIRVTVCCFCQCRLARQWVNDFILHHFTLAIIFNLKNCVLTGDESLTISI